MKVFSVTGTTGTGKTTVVEKLIAEFCARGYTVGSVKEIHYEQFRIDTEGKNTWRHRQAGASTVTALGMHETDVMYTGKMDIYDVLKHYDQDIVALEGVSDAVVPNIACAAEDGEPKVSPLTVAVSGRYANTHTGEYNGLPIYNAVTDVKALADLLLAKMPELMQDVDPKCCGLCGCDCRTFLSKCLKGEESVERCVLGNKQLSLKIDGEEIVIVPFVESVLKNVILGVVKELKGYKKGGKIEIAFCAGGDKVFESKKNRVTLLESGVIVKEFQNADACVNEEAILRMLDGNHAPRLIGRRGNALYTEYTEGRLLVDAYVNCKMAEAEALAGMLADAVREIYRVTGRITMDENFRNYVIKDGKVIRLDFEEAAEGTIESWCAGIFAFASLYEGIEESKLAFMKTLEQRLGTAREALIIEYHKELDFLSSRWGVPFPERLYRLFAEEN